MKAMAAPDKHVSRWWTLVVVHICMMAFAVTFQMIPPILETLVKQSGMSYSQAGLLMSLFTLPGVFLALPGGYLADRFGSRGITIFSLALMTAGTLIMLPVKPAFLFGGRVIAGMGVAVLAVVTPQIIASRFKGREMGLAMGIFNTAVPLGTVAALNTFGPVAGRWGTWSVMAAAGGFCLAATVAALAVLEKSRPKDTGQQTNIFKSTLGLGRVVWQVTLVWVLFNIAILSFFTYGIDFFTGTGFSPARAGFLSSLPMLVSVAGAPLTGIVMDRTGWRSSVILAGGIMCAAGTALVYYYPAWSLLWVTVLGLGVSTIPPGCFTLVAEGSPAGQVGLGYGLMATVFNAGVFLGIPWVGILRDGSGNYRNSFMVMCGMFLLAGLAALLARGDIIKIPKTH
jgi:cyanate permease